MTKIEIPTPINKVCLNDPKQSKGLACVKAIPRNDGGAWLAATNGRAAAIVPSLKSEIAEAVLIPNDIAAGAGRKSVVATLDGQWTNSKNRCADAVPPETPYPRLQEAIQPIEEDFCSFLSLDVASLTALAAAVSSSEYVYLMLRADVNDQGYLNQQIAVYGDLGVGCIMPAANKTLPAAEIAGDYNSAVEAFRAT
jgi:hypothetical protein